MTDLRERFIAAKLAGEKTEPNWVFGHMFHTNEQAAGAAVAVVAQWLREHADRANESSGHYGANPELQRQLRYVSAWIDDLADDIDPQEAKA